MGKISDLFKMERHMGTQPHHHHISLLIVGKILLVIALIILIKPAFTGFTISNQFKKLNITPADAIAKQEASNLQIMALEIKLEGCNENREELKAQITSETKEKTECLKGKGGLEIEMDRAKKDFEAQLAANLKSVGEEKADIAEQISEEKAKSEELENDFNELAVNSANNICCKVRVDDKAIDSYKIVDNRIVCGKGEANPISC